MSSPPTGPPPGEPRFGGSPSRRTRADRPVGRGAALLRLLRPRRRIARQETGPGDRLALDLVTTRHELARWQRHADSYERELARVSHERAHLLAWLAALHPSSALITPAADSAPGGTHVLRLVAGERQLSWRLPPADLPLFAHVPFAEPAPVFPRQDDHRILDQSAHIRRHTRLLAVEETLFTAPAEFIASTDSRPPVRPADH
ncbi:hypothetical protein [Streptomyces sp. NPDC005476]|uniref:hypothetical protein n=1 Tax=Streptomyces sp. NPDC005476 TaxID=3156882 RepID=UPI0034528CB6